jgi:hypothetical protein
VPGAYHEQLGKQAFSNFLSSVILRSCVYAAGLYACLLDLTTSGRLSGASISLGPVRRFHNSRDGRFAREHQTESEMRCHLIIYQSTLPFTIYFTSTSSPNFRTLYIAPIPRLTIQICSSLELTCFADSNTSHYNKMTSRYEGRGETPAITRRRNVLACARCRARRVKCDRATPSCSNCSKAGTLCQPVSATPQAPVPPPTGSRDPTEYNRLPKPEGEMAQLSREPSGEYSPPPSPEDSSEVRGYETRGKIVSGLETRYISPFSWAAVAEEVC